MLVQNSEKHTTITWVKEFYSTMSQAIKLSENENGPTTTWDYPAQNCPVSETLDWFNQYIGPHLKYTGTETATLAGSSYVVAHLNNGIDVGFYKGKYVDIGLFIKGFGPNSIAGKDRFYFLLLTDTDQNAFRTYDQSVTGTGRAAWTTGTNACTNSGNKVFCASLLQYENWTVPSDYPFWN